MDLWHKKEKQYFDIVQNEYKDIEMRIIAWSKSIEYYNDWLKENDKLNGEDVKIKPYDDKLYKLMSIINESNNHVKKDSYTKDSHVKNDYVKNDYVKNEYEKNDPSDLYDILGDDMRERIKSKKKIPDDSDIKEEINDLCDVLTKDMNDDSSDTSDVIKDTLINELKDELNIKPPREDNLLVPKSEIKFHLETGVKHVDDAKVYKSDIKFNLETGVPPIVNDNNDQVINNDKETYLDNDIIKVRYPPVAPTVPISGLTLISKENREVLYNNVFNQAKINVMQMAGDIDESKKEQLIFEEADRLLNYYKSQKTL
jgi:hypothetical protein